MVILSVNKPSLCNVQKRWLFTIAVANMMLSPYVTAFASRSPFSVYRSIHPIQPPSSPLAGSSFRALDSVQNFPRGGALTASSINTESSSILRQFLHWNESPLALFNSTLAGLALVILLFKVIQGLQNKKSDTTASSETMTTKPAEIRLLQRRFLPVFWFLRCADWLQGPYFYEVYSSKTLENGMTPSMSLVSRLFLTGFASTALFGPSVGRAADQYGRKQATLAFCLIYGLGALSTKSNLFKILFVGRVLSGIGTSLLFSAPESWLVGEAQASQKDPDGKYLGETFGLAYAGDSIVAIMAGKMAGAAAANRGPTGPFELSTVFLALGGILSAWLWKENRAKMNNDVNSKNRPSISEAIKVIRKDPKIMLVGGVQSLFEAAMYIFVLQWPPAVNAAICKMFGEASNTPYGTIFSCFMACCLLGSTIFGQLAKNNVATEKSATAMLSIATCAMIGATLSLSYVNLAAIITAMFAFEACVGMYFPSIGTMRSKYIPDSHRSVIMNLFGIPLNILVVSVFLSIDKIGVNGALSVSSVALGLATLCMLQLQRMNNSDKIKSSSR